MYTNYTLDKICLLQYLSDIYKHVNDPSRNMYMKDMC